MPVELNLKYTRNADTFAITVTDNTGAYDAADNPGGYGGINPAVGDFSTFEITVTPPDSSTLLPTGTPVTIDAYPSLPSITGGAFELTSLAIIGTASTALIDGVYLFEVAADWSNGGGDGTAEAEDYKAYYSIVACCINNMIVEAVGCGCSGSSKKMQTLAKAIANLYALSPKVEADETTVTVSPIEACGQWNKAATAILELQDICDNENCGGCNGCR